MFTETPRWRCDIGSQTHSDCNTKASGEVCDETLGSHADHAMICPLGPLSIQRRDLYADKVPCCIADIGAHVRREAWIGEFAVPAPGAVLDIWAFGSPEVIDLLVDVTICHPMAGMYQVASGEEFGHAASRPKENSLGTRHLADAASHRSQWGHGDASET